MIHIDFQGGAHGNFLEFVCNIAGNVKTIGTPFNQLGASHKKTYLSPKIFYADHYSFFPLPLTYNRVISITVDNDDLLPLSQISLLRAANRGYDSNELEINTYNKLNNRQYRWVLDNILNAFFTNQVADSYNAVKDQLWPSVSTLSDFQKLPEHIRNECINVHKLKLLELNEHQPDCPRYILREFFQHGFDDPSKHGLITQQKLMVYAPEVDVYNFPFNVFYNTEKFLEHIELIFCWAGIEYVKRSEVAELHRLFLEKQPYAKSKIKCDTITQQMANDPSFLPELNLIEEAYVNSILRKNGHESRY